MEDRTTSPHFFIDEENLLRPQISKPRIIIIGGGFGGLAVLHRLKRTDAEVILIDKRNHHLFQPLLYQIATAALNPSQIAVPLRREVELQDNCLVFLGQVNSIDLARSCVRIGQHESEYLYDYLVIATGVENNYYGNDTWREHAPGLKSLDDALAIRHKFLLAFEEAELATSQETRTAVLTFVVVGGGPTGVELAGAMAEISRTTLKASFRRFSSATARVVLVEGSARILESFPPHGSERAARDLKELGVEVITNARVTNIDEGSVRIKFSNGEETVIKTHNVIWAAGVKAGPLVKTLGVPLDDGGRVPVQHDLTVADHPNVFVIGDIASYRDPKLHTHVPGVAQGAIQMGEFVGKLIASELSSGRPEKRPTFYYHDKGSMATIGRGKAIAYIYGYTFNGLFAWLLWALIHVAFLVGFRNRITTIVQWIWMYFFYERSIRLITGDVKIGEDIKLPPDPRMLS